MTLPKLDQHQLQFDYLSLNYHQFEMDFYHYSKSATPLIFMADDILLAMAKLQRDYFCLDHRYAKDQQDHYFHFEVKSPKDNPLVHIYIYRYHSLNL